MLLSTNIDKVEIFRVLHEKISLLTRRRSEQNMKSFAKNFRKVWTI